MPLHVLPVFELRLRIVMWNPAPKTTRDGIVTRPLGPFQQPAPIQFWVVDVVPGTPALRARQWRTSAGTPGGEFFHPEALPCAQHRGDGRRGFHRPIRQLAEPFVVLEQSILD